MRWEIIKERVSVWMSENPVIVRNAALALFAAGAICILICLAA
jgi:hypothetical protein